MKKVEKGSINLNSLAPVQVPRSSCCLPVGLAAQILCQHDSETNETNPSSVKMKCSNVKCSIAPYCHGDCFSALEEELFKILERAHVRVNVSKWRDHQRETMLWTKCFDLIYNHCRFLLFARGNQNQKFLLYIMRNK